jgi:folate-binding protein YgfZ
MQNKQIGMHAYHPAALLRVTGEDAFTFLQGQFTNELRQVPDNVVIGLWLNQKGRVLADSYVLRMGEKEFVIVSLGSAGAIIQRRLEDYIVADDVAVADETSAVHGLVLWGIGCGDAVTALLGSAPASGKFLRHGHLLAFAGRRSSNENYEIIGSEESIRELRERGRGLGCTEAEAEALEVERMMAGIPSIPADLGPTDLPNEGGLEESAISYTKGCYLGQEVMARIKNLGQVRRHLRVVQGTGDAPKPGATLFQEGRKMGEIRSAAPITGGFIAMAMLTKLGLKEDAGLTLVVGGPELVRVRPHG